MAIRTISLCTGVGGLDLGLRIALGDVEPLVYVEREIEAAEILAARFKEGSLPAADVWSDLATFDARPYRGITDILCGGLPCQPFSVAGKQKGEQDERYIWHDFFRIVAECRPAVVFLENVPPFVSGGFFRPIGEELCRMGYEIEDPLFLAASDVGAPHKRERVFVLAVANNQEQLRWRQSVGILRSTVPASSGATGASVADPGSDRLYFDGKPHGWPQQPELGAPRREDPDRCDTPVALASERGRGELRESSGGDGQPDGSDAAVDDTAGPRPSGGEPESDTAPRDEARLRESGGRCDDVADTGSGTPGQGRGAVTGKTVGGRAYARPTGPGDSLFPPGPGDHDAWRELLVWRPWMRPATSQAEAESILCGDAPGLADELDFEDRTDRLRSLGNLVVPMQGAVAFSVLWDECVRRMGH